MTPAVVSMRTETGQIPADTMTDDQARALLDESSRRSGADLTQHRAGLSRTGGGR